MKSRTVMRITAITLFAALALPGHVAAQHTRYKLIDFGTFGGPSSVIAPTVGFSYVGGLDPLTGQSADSVRRQQQQQQCQRNTIADDLHHTVTGTSGAIQ